jgi:RNA polymerase sigma-70 factor (ECF subfamily)
MRFFGRRGEARLDELYVRFGPTIYARCRQMLRDRAAAEDITQETFLGAHRALARLRSDRETLVWLYRTATNRCLNELRNGRIRARGAGSLPRPDAAWPEQRLLDQDLVARLSAEMPEDLSTAAWLYHVDGHEQGAIAEICGVSRRTVVARLGRFAERARAFIQRSNHEAER